MSGRARARVPAPVARAAAAASRAVGSDARLAVILGSGLSGLAAALASPRRIPYRRIPGFPIPHAAGHPGELASGRLEGVPVLLLCGRPHYYEGHPPEALAFPVYMLAAMGITDLVVTNAAGGVRASLPAGALVFLRDHLNLMGVNPLRGDLRARMGADFPDPARAYDPDLRRRARLAARAAALPYREGVYAALAGPSYETRAEVRMLRHLGADVVGMSTVPEVLAAAAAGLRVLGISLVVNRAGGPSRHGLSHAQVLAAGRRGTTTLARWLRAFLSAYAAPRATGRRRSLTPRTVSLPRWAGRIRPRGRTAP